MIRYQTEIVVPPDRYVALQLPPDLPEGRAVVTVVVQTVLEPECAIEEDVESEDMEWWEEFEDDYERIA